MRISDVSSDVCSSDLETAHVAGALYIVLPAQWVHAHARAPDIAGRHGKVGDRHHSARPLRMFGPAKPVVDRCVLRTCIEPRRAAQFDCGDAGYRLPRIGRVGLIGNERTPTMNTLPIPFPFN